MEAFKEKYKFNYRTRDFVKFIELQNQEVYDDLGIEVQADREGNWLEFILTNDDKMYEEEISLRRKQIFETNDQTAIAEMKAILHAYTQEKEQAEH